MNKPKITFVMAIGRDTFLKTAVDSIINQTFKDWELFLYNNKGLLLETNNERIKIINTPDWRPAKCYNDVIEKANSDYILIATDDEFYFKERAMVTYHFLSNEVDYFAGSCIEADENLVPKRYIRLCAFDIRFHEHIANTISLPFVGYKKNLAPKFNEDFKICYDYLFTLECAIKGLNIQTSYLPLGLKRVWDKSLYNSTPKTAVHDEIMVIRKMLNNNSIRDHKKDIVKEYLNKLSVV